MKTLIVYAIGVAVFLGILVWRELTEYLEDKKLTKLGCEVHHFGKRPFWFALRVSLLSWLAVIGFIVFKICEEIKERKKREVRLTSDFGPWF